MMADNDTIRRLFNTVLYEEIRYHQLSDVAIRTGIQNMKEVYKPNPTSLTSEILDVANYNDPAHRCAYLHKYAPLHTALVSEMLGKSMRQVKCILEEIVVERGRLEVCSLGGGPGSDIIGVISVLSAELGFFQLSATIIDCMGKWRHTFGSLVRELRCENYGFLSDFVQPQYFEWNYIEHNLLGKMTNDVNKAIHGANLITMVKFVSAAACKDTSEMIKKVFRSLKPGALVLFIDNDAGGFYKLVIKGAEECNMVTVFGPLIHEHYTNMNFNVQRFGYTPCLETTVTVHMFMKPNYNKPDILSAAALGNSSISQTRNISNTVNQYSVSNTNVYVSDRNNSNLPRNNPRRKHFSNPRQQNAGNRSAHHIPIQREPQYHRLHSPNDDDDENDDREEEDPCNNCCVIS